MTKNTAWEQMSVGIAVGLFNPETFSNPDFEPKMGSVEIQIVDYDFKIVEFQVIENITMASMNKETNPEFFYKGSPNDR